LKLTTDRHEASRGLSATAEFIVQNYSQSTGDRDVFLRLSLKRVAYTGKSIHPCLFLINVKVDKLSQLILH